jgi:hypothetical protein
MQTSTLPQRSPQYSTQHPLTQAFAVPAKKPTKAKPAKTKTKAKAKPVMVKSKAKAPAPAAPTPDTTD